MAAQQLRGRRPAKATCSQICSPGPNASGDGQTRGHAPRFPLTSRAFQVHDLRRKAQRTRFEGRGALNCRAFVGAEKGRCGPISIKRGQLSNSPEATTEVINVADTVMDGKHNGA